MGNIFEQLRGSSSGLFREQEDGYARAEARDARQRRQDATLPDAYFAYAPIPASCSITGLIRHASLRTGFTFAELERISGAGSGAFASVAAGEKGEINFMNHGYDYERLLDFINISRAVEATFSRPELRSWWLEKRHGKRLPPIGLITGRRQRDEIFAAYEDELTHGPESVLYLRGGVFVESPHRIPGFKLVL